jgi:hypothetical protein
MEDKTAAQGKSSDDEEDNIPIAASILTAPKRTNVDFKEYIKRGSRETVRLC